MIMSKLGQYLVKFAIIGIDFIYIVFRSKKKCLFRREAPQINRKLLSTTHD